MTRTGAYRAIYFAVLGCGALLVGGGALLLANGHEAPGIMMLSLLVVLLLPGRIQAYFWSDLLAGLHQLNQQNYEASKVHSERFLVQLRKKPWLKALIWLGTSSYSRNAEVLALNNLGAAMLKLGETEGARAHLARAIELDPKCPLPYRNMGALVLSTGTFAEAKPWLEKATSLGWTGGWSDSVVSAAQARNAARSTAEVNIAPPPTLAPALAGAFAVNLVDDDRTPMEFVVTALEQVFGLTGAEAVRIMLAVHHDGSAPCAAFETKQAAQAKADQLTALARAAGHPLSCEVVTRIWT